MPIASLGFRTDIMLLTLGGSSITRHDGLTVVATPSTPDFWWGNFVLAPDGSALDAAVALHAEMFPEADFVSVGIDGTDGALGIDAAAAGRGLKVFDVEGNYAQALALWGLSGRLERLVWARAPTPALQTSHPPGRPPTTQ